MDELIDEELIDEVFITGEEEIIGEGENAKKQICFKGIFSEADSLNGNKRIYPKKVLREVYEEAIARTKATGKPIYGEWEHAKNAKMNLDNLAVTFPELTWNEEKGTIEGKAVPTLMECGEKVIKLAKSGFPVCFSTRMAGKVKPLSEERKRELGLPLTEDCVEVMPGAKLISIDVVGDPSCQKAVSETVYEEKEENINHNPTFKQIFDNCL